MKKNAKTVTRVPRLPKRDRDAHKGDFGRVLVIGGSTGMLGAPALCANAAYRAGAGLVRIAVEGFLAGDMTPLVPCATFVPYLLTRSLWELRDRSQRPADALGDRQLLEMAWAVLNAAQRDNTVLAVGPGWSVDPARQYLLEQLIEHLDRPMVLDADGLNLLCRIRNAGERLAGAASRGATIVFTPHPGEARRMLTAFKVEVDLKKDRVKAARALQDQTGGIVVLKGAGTVVTDGARVYVNRTGNPGMATGGTGDVLTGVIAGLVAQGLSPFDAAVVGVHVHGAAGDAAAKTVGHVSLMATDVLNALPAAFQRM